MSSRICFSFLAHLDIYNVAPGTVLVCMGEVGLTGGKGAAAEKDHVSRAGTRASLDMAKAQYEGLD